MRSRMSPPLSTLGATCAAALLAAAPLAFAAPNATTTARHDTTPSAVSSTTTSSSTTRSEPIARQTNTQGEHARLTEERAKAIESVKVDPTQAIETAQKMHGTAFFVRFELRHGTPAYLIRTYQGDQEWAGLVNADTGQLMGKGRVFKTIDKEDMQRIEAAKSVHTDLLQAVKNAQAERPHAKLLEVALETEKNGPSHYTVDLAENGQLHVAVLNPQSGHFE